MIFLSKLNNMTLCRAVCYPDDMPRLNRNTAIIMPTDDEEVFLDILDKLKYNRSRLRIKGINYMYVPKYYNFKAGIKTIRFHQDHFLDKVKELKVRSHTVATNTTTNIRNYNVVFNYTPIAAHLLDPSVNYTSVSSRTVWDALLNYQDIEHLHKYILFTPEITKINVKNKALIKMSSYKVRNLYIRFLYQLIYHYDTFVSFLRNNNIALLFTDHRFSFKVDFNDSEFETNYPDKEDFFKALFMNLKRMQMGLPVEDEDVDLEEVINKHKEIKEEIASNDEGDKTIDDTTVTKTMAIVDAFKKSNSALKDEIEEVADEVTTTIDTVEDNTEESKPAEKEVKENKKEKVLKEKIIKIQNIVTKDQKREVSVPTRLVDVKKKQDEIMNDNLVEVLAKLENMAESMITPDVIKENSSFGTFSINKLDEQYEAIAKKDRLAVAESLNKTSVPLYLTGYKDKQNMDSKDTYTRKVQMTFESPYNSKEKHTFTMNIPELRDGKFLHINGSDKVMIRQKMALPIIKLDDGVVITSYYGKLFLSLTTGNLSKSVARIKSFIKLMRKKFPQNYLKKWFSFIPAYYVAKDENFLGPELLEISRFMTYCKIDENNYIDLGTSSPVVGKINGEIYKANQSEDRVTNSVDGSQLTTLEFFHKILSRLETEDPPLYKLWMDKATGTVSKNISYSKVDKWPGGSTPTIFMVMHAFGDNLLEILELLKKDYNLVYEVVPFDGEKKPKSEFLGDDADRFLFGNFALDVIYSNVSNRHLLQPLHDVDLTQWDSLMLDGFSNTVTTSSNVVMAMETYEDLFLDPITIKVMEDCGMPNNYGEALIYANNLLQNYDRTVSEISLKNERMPSNSEIIQGAMYACLAKEYRDYSIKVKRGSKMASFSVQQDAVITYLSTLPNVEESSKINAIQHVDKMYTISNKGISGINNSRSYTVIKRKWDKTFYGVMSDVSPYGPATGVTKHLAINPNIKDVRGYFISKDPTETRDDELMAVSEALRPFTQKHDSSPRTAMSMMQSNHLMGTEGSEPAYVTYGMDETMSYLDSDFAKRLKDDGEILSINDRFMKIRYNNLKNEDGTFVEEVIDLDVIERNSAKAFFTPNKMVINSKYRNAKPGTKIKKDEIIAYNSNYYAEAGDDIIFKSGPIVNIALMNTQYAYEDATVMTESLAKKLQTKVLKRIAVKLNPRNQIKEVRTLLGPIAGGDVLIKVSEDSGSSFLNSAYDLSALEDRLLKVEKSNYNGILRDIYVYYKLTTKEEEEMDPTIKEFMKKVDSFYKRKYDGVNLAKNLPAYEKNRVIDHVTKFTDNRKNTINGDLVNKGEILVEFFIEVNQNFSSGDKITIGNTALKGVGSKILTDDQAPIGVETGKKYDLILSTYGPLSRMIYSSFLVGPLTAAMQKINENILDIINNDETKK